MKSIGKTIGSGGADNTLKKYWCRRGATLSISSDIGICSTLKQYLKEPGTFYEN